MRRSPLKWTIIGAALAAVLLFGMEMTAGGINRVYGPLGNTAPEEIGRYAEAARAQEQERLQQLKYEKELEQLQKKYGMGGTEAADGGGDFAGDEEAAYVSAAASGSVGDLDPKQKRPSAESRLPGIEDVDGETGVNRLADGTAGMLQSVSSSGIRFLVTLFDSMTQ